MGDYSKRFSASEASRRLGVSLARVRRLAHELLPLDEANRYMHGRYFLTAADVRVIGAAATAKDRVKGYRIKQVPAHPEVRDINSTREAAAIIGCSVGSLNRAADRMHIGSRAPNVGRVFTAEEVGELARIIQSSHQWRAAHKETAP